MMAISPELHRLITAYIAAEAAWEADEEEPGWARSVGPTRDAFDCAIDALLDFRCGTLADVERKIAFTTECQSFREMVAGDLPRCLPTFCPVDNGDNGEKS